MPERPNRHLIDSAGFTACGHLAAPTVHAFGRYYAVALCGSSPDDDNDAPATDDLADVTCKECRRRLAIDRTLRQMHARDNGQRHEQRRHHDERY